MTAQTPSQDALPSRFGMILFPGFQPLDVFGPLGIFNIFSRNQKISLAIIAATLDPVSTSTDPNAAFQQSVVPTHTFASPPDDLEVLFVPGGMGTRAPESELAEMFAYIRTAYSRLRYIISICTGAGLIARAGVLDGRRATTNKLAWAQTVAHGPKTYWVAKARWVVDGNVYSSSGVTAGIDATLAWIGAVYGEETAKNLAVGIEHNRVEDPADDPFATYYGVKDVPPVQE